MDNQKYSRLPIKELIAYFDGSTQGISPMQFCATYKISLDVYYQWKALFDGMSPMEIKKFFDINKD